MIEVVKHVLVLLLIFSFLNSLSGGEDLCCDSLSDIENVNSTEAHNVPSHKAFADRELHFCQQSENSQHSDNEDCHLCVGCVHSGFVVVAEIELQSQSFDNQSAFTESFGVPSTPCLDGPFQPPKA